MAWIKRNLLFFIGGVVALLLLGAAGFYNYTSWSRNSEMLDKLKEIYAALNALNDPQSNPGNDKVNKIDQAKDQTKQLQDWLTKSKDWFAPIPPIPHSTPADPLTSENFSAALRRTIDQLQHEAQAANVQIAPDYGFSFEAERSLVKFSPGSPDLLAEQIGEVKTITEIMFGAGVNEFDGIQRVRVASEDSTGPQGDYINDQSVTNDQAVVTPYVVAFQSFGPEIAKVYAGFAGSPHCFIIKSINILPTTGNSPAVTMNTPPDMGLRGMGMANVAGGVPAKGGLTTVLQEKLLRVSLEVEIIKLQSKN